MIKDSKGNELRVGDKVFMKINRSFTPPQPDEILEVRRHHETESLFLLGEHDTGKGVKDFYTRSFSNKDITKLW